MSFRKHKFNSIDSKIVKDIRVEKLVEGRKPYRNIDLMFYNHEV